MAAFLNPNPPKAWVSWSRMLNTSTPLDARVPLKQVRQVKKTTDDSNLVKEKKKALLRSDCLCDLFMSNKDNRSRWVLGTIL